MKVASWLLWISAGAFNFVAISETQSPWDAIHIVNQAHTKDQENRVRAETASCRLQEISEDLDEGGVVEDREEKITFLKLSAVPAPGAEEGKRITPQVSKNSSVDDNSILDLVDFFDWVLEGEDGTQGESCYRLAFRPKTSQAGREGRGSVMIQTAGRCWVAKRDFSRIRLEGRLLHPVKPAGFLLQVQEVEFLSTNRRVESGGIFPEQNLYRFRVEMFPCFQFHERHCQRFEFPWMAKS